MSEINAVFRERFDAIERRTILALNQLEDDQVNWKPNDSSNSISNLIIHMEGYVKERIGMGVNDKPFSRDRDQEFEWQYRQTAELIEIVHSFFDEIKSALSSMNNESYLLKHSVGNREQTNLEIFIQCASHLSEHMGQILYIAKMIRDDDYVTTSIPRKKPL